MNEWWIGLEPFMKTLWGIAIFSSLVFVIQTIMTFVGMDSGSDFNTDIDSDIPSDSQPFQLFTFRNLINFLLGFSWTAITLMSSMESTPLLLFISVIVGVLLVIAVMYIFKWLSGMEQSGNIETESAVGCTGTVYLTIPAERKGEGKVQISVQGAIREYDAVTDGERLANNEAIKVVKVINANTLLVEKA